MFDYYALEALAAVVQERSFNRAAGRLFITQSAVSQRIRSLEESVGLPLIVRSPEIKPTPTGQQLLTHFRQVALLEESVRQKWPSKKKEGTPFPISIAVNTESLSTWFIEAIRPVIKAGHFLVEILIDDQERTPILLQNGRAWGCISSVPHVPHGCVSTFLGEMIYRLVATPEFRGNNFKRGVSGATLLKAPAVVYGENDYMHRNFLCTCFKSYAKGRPNLHFVPSPQGIVQFAVDGLGYALLPAVSIQGHHLNKRTLVDLMPERAFRLPLYWQTQELQTELTREMSQGIISHAKGVLR